MNSPLYSCVQVYMYMHEACSPSHILFKAECGGVCVCVCVLGEGREGEGP